MLSDAVGAGAQCLDGTPPGYHIQSTSAQDPSTWVIHLQGGGWCTSLQGCAARAKGALGSSKARSPLAGPRLAFPLPP